MLSDALFEGIREIESWERERPDAYGSPELKAKIAHVKETMLALQRELDAVDPFAKKEG